MVVYSLGVIYNPFFQTISMLLLVEDLKAGIDILEKKHPLIDFSGLESCSDIEEEKMIKCTYKGNVSLSPLSISVKRYCLDGDGDNIYSVSGYLRSMDGSLEEYAFSPDNRLSRLIEVSSSFDVLNKYVYDQYLDFIKHRFKDNTPVCDLIKNIKITNQGEYNLVGRYDRDGEVHESDEDDFLSIEIFYRVNKRKLNVIYDGHAGLLAHTN